MKRFKWQLQRLLDVTLQRERSLRLQIVELSREIARRRREIVARRAALNAVLAELARLGLPERIGKQEVLMDCCAAKEQEIEGLQREVQDLESQRSARRERFAKTRSARQTLERLRDQARQRHIREQLRLEQKQLDEAAHIAFARTTQTRRAAGAG